MTSAILGYTDIINGTQMILDEYFAEQMKEIIKQSSYSRQTMLFSATLNDEVKDLAASCLKSPVKILINSNTEVVMNLHHEFIRIHPNRKVEREAILSDVIKVKKKKKKLSELMQMEEKVINVEDSIKGEEIDYDPSMTFQQMHLSRPLQKAIAAMNFLHPTPIQAATIPIALMGRDIYGCAATGTGKTAAFMLPVLEHLLFKPKDQPVTRVLIVLPTRELAVQVYQVSKQLAQFTKIEIALSAGGLELKAQELALRRLPDIIIATPGRLIDHLENTPSFNLNYIEILILDEADRILDEYFAEQMKEIIKQCSYSRQTMLFSATLNDEVKDLAASCLKSPVKIFINSNTEVAMNLHQEFIRIRPNREAEREPILSALVQRTFQNRVMIFAQTKMQVHRLYILLGLMGIKAAELHGNLNQPQQLESLRKFKQEEVDVLVATDVAARGLDIPGVKTVINFTLPCTLQHYIHRVGRTARAGRSGRSISMVGEKERKMLKEIVKKAKNPVKHRVIPPEIISKYQTLLSSLEEDLSQVMRHEKEEKELQSMEKNLGKAERIVSEKKQPEALKRTWFQSPAEKKKEKNVIKVKKKKMLSELMQMEEKVINVEDSIKGEEIDYDPSMTFQQMHLSRPLQKAIAAMNFLHPTPIQAATIAIALMGRDIYGCAATGTGKTAAFMLPVLERLLFKPKDQPVTRVLVVLPTRELAVQVYQVSKQLAQFTKIEIALSAGGLELKAQALPLRRLPDIVIATPGRLIDHLENTPSFNLNYIEILILDEADRILDEYFAEQMTENIKQCSYSRQTMLFSATLNDEVKDLAASCLKSPVKIFINSNTEVTMNLHQEFIRIRPNREAEREAILSEKQQKRKSFDAELADTSRTNVKKFRYEATHHVKMEKLQQIQMKKQANKKFKSKSRYRRKI